MHRLAWEHCRGLRDCRPWDSAERTLRNSRLGTIPNAVLVVTHSGIRLTGTLSGARSGTLEATLTENEFTVTASDGPEFSPPLYPLGFPLILAPFVAVVGDDLNRLTIVPVLKVGRLQRAT